MSGVQEPSIEDTISILRGLKHKYELHHRVHITDGAIIAAALMSQRYLTERKLPDKAVDLIDEAAARLRMQQESKPDQLHSLERALLTAKIELEALKNDHDPASQQRRATIEGRIRGQEAEYRQGMERWEEEKARKGEYNSLKEQLEAAEQRLQAAMRQGDYNAAGQLKHVTIPQLQQRLQDRGGANKAGDEAAPLSLLGESVTSEDVAAVVARHTGIPVSRLLVGERERLLTMEERLRQRVVGQDRAVASISNCIRIARAGLHAHTKPMGGFLFLGPSGVGKSRAQHPTTRRRPHCSPQPLGRLSPAALSVALLLCCARRAGFDAATSLGDGEMAERAPILPPSTDRRAVSLSSRGL